MVRPNGELVTPDDEWVRLIDEWVTPNGELARPDNGRPTPARVRLDSCGVAGTV